MPIDRRSLLTGAGAGALLGFSPGCATIIKPVPTDIGFAAIDIHSHFFNASDLPVKQFLKRVVLQDHNDYRDQKEFRATGVRDAFLDLLVDILRYRTLSADEERAKILKNKRALDSPSGPLGREALQAGLETQAKQVQRQQSRSARRFKALDPSARLALPASPDENLLGEIEASVGLPPVRPSVGGSSPESLRQLSPAPIDQRLRARRIVGQVYRKKDADNYQYTGVIPTALRWAALLTEDRTDILDEYVRLYRTSAQKEPGSRGLVAASPSIVDFSFWLDLDDEKLERKAIPSSLHSQVRVLSTIAQSRSDIALIPFVPFDPLRDAVGGLIGTSPSLDLVKDAINHHGFAGVKLYPPMGFRPSNNADPGVNNDYAQRVLDKAKRRYSVTDNRSAGTAIDDALRALYEWAEENNVPIKAHSNNSIESQKGGGLKAAPGLWRDVLSKYRGLRINLAHFGGFEEGNPCAGSPCNSDDQDWEDVMGDILNSTDNLYFDTGYWMELIYDQRDGNGIRERTRAFLKAYPKAKKKMMFGTDWSMIGKDPGHELYLNRINRAIIDDFEFDSAEQQDYFGRNAIAFLGLDERRTLFARQITTRTRFEEFYRGIPVYDRFFALIDDRLT